MHSYAAVSSGEQEASVSTDESEPKHRTFFGIPPAESESGKCELWVRDPDGTETRLNEDRELGWSTMDTRDPSIPEGTATPTRTLETALLLARHGFGYLPDIDEHRIVEIAGALHGELTTIRKDRRWEVKEDELQRFGQGMPDVYDRIYKDPESSVRYIGKANPNKPPVQRLGVHYPRTTAQEAGTGVSQ